MALLLTNGYTSNMPHWPPDRARANNVTDLGSLIYIYLNQPSHRCCSAPAEAAVVVLLVFVLADQPALAGLDCA